MEVGTSVQLPLELALKALIPYLQSLDDPAGLFDFLDEPFPPGFLFMAGHEAQTLPDDQTSYLAFIAGLANYRAIAMRYPQVLVRMELATAGIADEATRAAAVLEHSRRASAVMRLFSMWYYPVLKSLANTPSGADELLLLFKPASVSKQQDRFDISNSGLANDDQIRFELGAPDNSLPAPISESVYYFVVNASSSNFQIATTQGGAPVDITTSGNGENEIFKRGSGGLDQRPWAGLAFDAWNAQPPLEGESPSGKHFIASLSYLCVIHFTAEPDEWQPDS